jgi:hypothetical protein
VLSVSLQVSVGSHFSAGGWSGSVRKVVRDNHAAVQSATAGMGVHLTVIMSKLCDDPRPLGDRIFFHGPRSGTKLSRGDMERSREAAEGVMLQNQLQAKIGTSPVAYVALCHYSSSSSSFYRFIRDLGRPGGALLAGGRQRAR